MDDEGHGERVLIVAGVAAASPDELPENVRARIRNASELLVVTPVLPSMLHLWTNDTDRAREQADERLAAVMGSVAALDPDAQPRGAVGDEVPLTAFDDAVRTFQPDRILIGLRTGSGAGWQEKSLPERVKSEFGLPVTALDIDDDGRVVAIDEL